MGEKPFIQCFKTPKSKYFYDFNTNAIVRVSDDVFEVLKKGNISEPDTECRAETKQQIEELKEKGFLKNSRWQHIEHPSNRFLKYLLNSSAKSMTLQVTQQCNLKCNYCPYSGSYYNREHNNRNMTFETAKKAVDFYITHAFDMPSLQVGFYGGEPLIQYDLIKKVVEYCEGKCFGKKVQYRMTTNATLLTDEIIDFLMTHDFTLTISLDGPQNYHDKNRHRIDDSGSFSVVLKNIDKIYSKYPEKKESIMFNCVLDPENDMECVNEFFLTADKIREYRVLFSPLSRDGIKDEEQFLPDESYIEQYQYELFKLFYEKTKKVDQINVSKIVESYYLQIKNSYADRMITGLTEETSHPSGPCIPGCHKLFVDVEGNFYPCEKVCECSNEMIIGNVWDGFEFSRVERVLNVGKLTAEQCKNCWSAKFCFLCASHLDQGDGISKELKLSNCEQVRANVLDDFKDYCMLQELHGFDDPIVFLTEERV